jgi:hypothetical protein
MVRLLRFKIYVNTSGIIKQLQNDPFVGDIMEKDLHTSFEGVAIGRKCSSSRLVLSVVCAISEHLFVSEKE